MADGNVSFTNDKGTEITFGFWDTDTNTCIFDTGAIRPYICSSVASTPVYDKIMSKLLVPPNETEVKLFDEGETKKIEVNYSSLHGVRVKDGSGKRLMVALEDRSATARNKLKMKLAMKRKEEGYLGITSKVDNETFRFMKEKNLKFDSITATKL